MDRQHAGAIADVKMSWPVCVFLYSHHNKVASKCIAIASLALAKIDLMVDIGKALSIAFRNLPDFFEHVFFMRGSHSSLSDLHVKGLCVGLHGGRLFYAAVIFLAIFHRHDRLTDTSLLEDHFLPRILLHRRLVAGRFITRRLVGGRFLPRWLVGGRFLHMRLASGHVIPRRLVGGVHLIAGTIFGSLDLRWRKLFFLGMYTVDGIP